MWIFPCARGRLRRHKCPRRSSAQYPRKFRGFPRPIPPSSSILPSGIFQYHFYGDKLYNILYSGYSITTTTSSIDAKTGVLSYSGTAGNEYQAANYVNNIINSGLFASVDYLGYSYSAGSTVSTGTTSSTAQAATAPSYSFTYTALMKGGVGQ